MEKMGTLKKRGPKNSYDDMTICFNEATRLLERTPFKGAAPCGRKRSTMSPVSSQSLNGANSACRRGREVRERGLYSGAIIQDWEFGTFLKKAPQRQNLGLNWDFFGTIFIPFWDF